MNATNCLICQKSDIVNVCYECRKNAGSEVAIIERTLLRLNATAEADILKGNPITGAHHRAIEKILRELK